MAGVGPQPGPPDTWPVCSPAPGAAHFCLLYFLNNTILVIQPATPITLYSSAQTSFCLLPFDNTESPLDDILAMCQ